MKVNQNMTPSEVTQAPFSKSVEAWLNKMVGFIKTHFNLPSLSVSLDEYNNTSFTDGLKVYLGGDFPIFKEAKSANEALSAIRGVCLHEIAHILYTPFETTKIVENSIKNHGEMWPFDPSSSSSLTSWLKDATNEDRNAFFKIYFTITNILEDGRIEYLAFEQLRRFGGFIVGLKTLRSLHWEKMKSVDEKINEYEECETDESRHESAFLSVIDMLLMIAKYGSIKDVKDEHWDHFLLKCIPEASDYASDAVSAVNARDFFIAANEVVSILFDDFIKPFLEDKKEEAKSQEESGDDESDLSEMIKNSLEELLKNMPENLQNSQGSQEQMESTQSAKQEVQNGANTSSSAQEGEGESFQSSSSDEEENGGSTEGSEKEGEASNDNTCINRIATSSFWSGDEGGTEYSTQDENVINGIDLEAIERVKAAAERSENVRDYDASLSIPDIDYGSAHKGITIKVKRPEMQGPLEVMDSQYNMFSDYISAGKKAANIIKPNLEPENKAQWTKNRYYGGKFNASAAYNPNLRHFSRRIATPKTPSLSIAILIDESGSMYGDKIKVAQATAIALYEMCKELDVPFAVFGHATSGESSITVRNYCFFGETDETAKYRLLSVRDRNAANRDGAALRYVAEQLSRQNTDRKLLFTISDGQPYHMSSFGTYEGTAAEQDIRNVVKAYRGRQVAIISAAIDQDKERIKGIYGAERFLAIDNLEELPKELLDVIRRVMFY